MRTVVLLLCLILPMRAENAPTPTLTPHQQLAQELATLRTAQAIAQLSGRQTTEAEMEATGKLYLDLIQRFPEEAEPRAGYGEFLRSAGKNQEAFAQWQLALKIDPARDDILAAQADILLQTGQIVAAADAFEKAASMAPANASHLYGLAHIYTLFRRDLIPSRRLTEEELITRGTEYFKRASELAPDNLTYAKAYAEAFYNQPNPDWTIARAAWEYLLQRSEEKTFIHSHLVRVNIRLKDKAEASRHLAFMTEPAFAKLKATLQKQIDKL